MIFPELSDVYEPSADRRYELVIIDKIMRSLPILERLDAPRGFRVAYTHIVCRSTFARGDGTFLLPIVPPKEYDVRPLIRRWPIWRPPRGLSSVFLGGCSMRLDEYDDLWIDLGGEGGGA